MKNNEVKRRFKMAKGKYFYNRPRTVCVGIDAVSAGSTTELPVFVAPFRCKITKVSIVPSSAITGADTNYMTLGFKNKGGSGSGTAVMASQAFTSGNDVSAHDEFTFGESVVNNTLNKGDVISFYKAESGTGMDMPALLAKIEYIRV